MTKSLTVYFSITGKTRRTAQYVGMCTDSDLFEIKPLLPYTEEDLDWRNPSSRSYKEYIDLSSRPPIFHMPDDLQSYTVIYIGYPLWYEDVPRIMMTFLSQIPKKGQTIIPFATGEQDVLKSGEHLQEMFGQDFHILSAVHLSDDMQMIKKWLKII